MWKHDEEHPLWPLEEQTCSKKKKRHKIDVCLFLLGDKVKKNIVANICYTLYKNKIKSLYVLVPSFIRAHLFSYYIINSQVRQCMQAVQFVLLLLHSHAWFVFGSRALLHWICCQLRRGTLIAHGALQTLFMADSRLPYLEISPEKSKTAGRIWKLTLTLLQFTVLLQPLWLTYNFRPFVVSQKLIPSLCSKAHL